jgi:hypothetical protein
MAIACLGFAGEVVDTSVYSSSLQQVLRNLLA